MAGEKEVVVCLPDGTMPEGISDLELVRVPTRIEEGDAKTETMSDETAERMARTRFIVDEYTMGVLDEQEAGERLFRHLFPHWGWKKADKEFHERKPMETSPIRATPGKNIQKTSAAQYPQQYNAGSGKPIGGIEAIKWAWTKWR